MSAPGPITAAELEELLADLIPIGLGEDGATTRLPWTGEDARAAEWFTRRARALGRECVRDPAGNLWAPPAGVEPPWWGAGSHLDTVLRGGRYDGALGVAGAFAVAAREPVAVLSFADEEGARWGTPTFGSRALAGRLEPDELLERRDADGITLAEALSSAGVDPAGIARAPEWRRRLRGFVEMHVDQTLELAESGTPVGVVLGLAARMRVVAEVAGRADHAGTTRAGERHDALLAAARLIVAAEQLAGLDEPMTFTAARIEVEPNAASTVPARVRVWLLARAERDETVLRWRERLGARSRELADAAAVTIELSLASWSAASSMTSLVRERLAAAAAEAAGAETVPELVCWAGHDAGMLAETMPAGMLLVRNPVGVSHAPEEDVSLDDAAVAANALLAAVRSLR
jgi:beta-ureidopropionase / N-carbamoyl-L-amino-acid hydrolase